MHIQDLLALELTRKEVAFLHRTGALVRPRVGWYCDPALSTNAIRAVRVGGALGCMDAAETWGIVVPERRRGANLHVSLAQNSSRLRRADDGRPVAAGDDHAVVWHWEHRLLPVAGHRVSPIDALLQMSACVTPPWFVAALDSAMRMTDRGRLVDPDQMSILHDALSPRLRTIAAEADGYPESAGESLAKVGLRRAGIPFRLQVRIGRRRCDILIDEWIVLEIDGRWHSLPDAFADDRARDLEFAARGYRVIRLTYRQIIDDWPSVLAVIQRVRAERRV